MYPEILKTGKLFEFPRKSIGFNSIPKKYLDEKNIQKSVEFMQEQLSLKTHLNDYDDQIKRFQRFFARRDHPEFAQELSGSEQKKRHAIHQEFIKNLTTSSMVKVFNNDHATSDRGNRYFAEDIMHYSGDKNTDLQYNRRITELIDRAMNKEFADDTIKNIEDDARRTAVTADREEFLGHIRKYVGRVEKIDLTKMVSNGLSDEDLAKDPLFYSELSLLTTQFDNVRHDLQLWGITDEQTSNTIDHFYQFGDFFSAINQRLGLIMDPTYEIFDEKTLPDGAFHEDHDVMESGVSDMITESSSVMKNFVEYSLNAEQGTIKHLFEELGFQKDDIVCNAPGMNNHETEHLFQVLQTGKPLTVHSKSQPGIQMTFDNYQNMQLTRIMLAENKLDFRKVMEKPKELGFWDKFTDGITSLFTSRKPKAEKYEKDVKSYNSLAVIFDPKSVIPTEPPVQKTPLHDLLGIRHLLKKEDKTKDDFKEIMNRFNEYASSNDPGKAVLQNSFNTLTEKFSRQVDAYNEAHPNPKDKVVLMGRVAEMLIGPEQNAPQDAPQNVRQVNQPVQPHIIEGGVPQNAPQNVRQVNQPVQPHIVEGGVPQNGQIITGIQKPAAAKPAPLESLKKEKEIVDLYSGGNTEDISSMLAGHISLHESLEFGAKDEMKGDPVSCAALFGLAPEKFPGREGLTPMEKKMQYLQRVFTEKDFTKNKEHQQFLAQCCDDYKKIRNSAYKSTVKGSKETRNFVKYQNEAAQSMQHLAVRPGRMTSTIPMLDACSTIVKQELSNFRSQKLQENRLTENDLKAINNVNTRCDGLQVLGKAYSDCVEAKYNLSNTFLTTKKEGYLSSLMLAEYLNRTVIAPAQKDAGLAAKKNDHPVAQSLDSLGANKNDKVLADIHEKLKQSSTFNAFKKVSQPNVLNAILKQPEKLERVAADISKEISTEKAVHADAEKYVNHLFDPKNKLDKNNLALS